MTVQDVPPVAAALTRLGIPHQVFRHAGPVHSLEQAASERNQAPQQVVRSLLFRRGEGDFAMVLTAGPDRVSWRALRRYLGQSRLTTAPADEVADARGRMLITFMPAGSMEAFFREVTKANDIRAVLAFVARLSQVKQRLL
jgi:Cys-tRNA(Pro)/Cys-tRNA(Cys) deacylase